MRSGRSRDSLVTLLLESNTSTYLHYSISRIPNLQRSLEKVLGLVDNRTDNRLLDLAYLDYVIEEPPRLYGAALE